MVGRDGGEAHRPMPCGNKPLAARRLEPVQERLQAHSIMAAGRASVASPIGANCDVVVAEETGLFARNDEEWYSQINRLRQDAELRRRLGRQARRRCEKMFSIEALGKNLSELILRLGKPSGSLRELDPLGKSSSKAPVERGLRQALRNMAKPRNGARSAPPGISRSAPE